MAVDEQQTMVRAPRRKSHLATPAQCQSRRRLVFLRRRNKLPTVRLGDKKPRRGHFIVRMLKKMRLKWVKLQYTCMVKKMRKYYRDLIKDIIEAGASVEALHQRMFMESSFAVPAMGLSFSSYTSSAAAEYRQRALIF